MDSSAGFANSQKQPNKNCQICLDDIESDIEFLPCIHAFHSKCIRPWLAYHPTCPICKTPIHIQSPQQLVAYNENKERQDERDVRESRFFQNISSGAFDINRDNLSDEPTHVFMSNMSRAEDEQGLRLNRAIPTEMDVNTLMNLLMDNPQSSASNGPGENLAPMSQDNSTTDSDALDLGLQMATLGIFAFAGAISRRNPVTTSNPYPVQSARQTLRNYMYDTNPHRRRRNQPPYTAPSEEELIVSPGMTFDPTRPTDLDTPEYRTFMDDIATRQSEPGAMNNLTGEYDDFHTYATNNLLVEISDEILSEHTPNPEHPETQNLQENGSRFVFMSISPADNRLSEYPMPSDIVNLYQAAPGGSVGMIEDPDDVSEASIETAREEPEDDVSEASIETAREEPEEKSE